MSDVRDTEPRLLKEPRGGVPDVTSTLDGYHRVCDAMAEATGLLAADAERASGFRYGHEDWLIQFKREGAGIALLDPVALTRAGADWNEFNDAVGDATWILHDSLMDLPGFAEIGLKPKALFDTEIAARLLGLHRFGLASFLIITICSADSKFIGGHRSTVFRPVTSNRLSGQVHTATVDRNCPGSFTRCFKNIRLDDA